MARQLRIEYEGAFYHIISRGNQRDIIFFEDSDFMKFIEILKRTKERYNYILHAYCLMSNHYHLLIETPKANLNRLMQNINTSYVVFVNRKYRRSGHLFQGRYKAIVVDKDNYLLSLSKYIHLNPVKAGIVTFPEEYRWSSYREYIGYVHTGIVDINNTLAYFSKKLKTAMMEYKKFVDCVNKDEKDPLKDVKACIVLGGEKFIEKIKEIVKTKQIDKEVPALERLAPRISMEEVVKKVADYYSLFSTYLRKRTRKYSKQRKIAIYLSKIATGRKNSEIGSYFGISPQAITNILTKVEDEIQESNELKKEITDVKCIL